MAQAANHHLQDFFLSLSDLSELTQKSMDQLVSELSQFSELPSVSRNNKSGVPPKIVRQYLSSLGYRYPHQVVSFQMLKGGVSKTTSALNFGLRAAQYGARVLFIDLDQQANLSFCLGVEDENLPVWVDIVEKKVSCEQAAIQIEDGVDLIPSSLNNSVLDRVLLNSQRNFAQAVAQPLKSIKSFYDLIVIDTAPSLSVINTAVTCASDVVVLPINPDKFSLLGLVKNMQDLEELKSEFNLDFAKKILFTKFDGRETASREILSHCIEKFESSLLKSYIRTSSEIKNSIREGRHIFSTKTSAKIDYDLVTCELLGFRRDHAIDQ